jgi:hypothetical protein
MRMRVLCFVLAAAASLFASSADAQIYYYRWSSAPGYTCSTPGPGVQVLFASQPVEWNTPVGAQFNVIYVTNGVETPTGPFPAPPPPPGSMVFGPLAISAPAYPASWAVRLETLVGGQITYQSTMSASCNADSVGTATISNLAIPRAIPALGIPATTLLIALMALAGFAVFRRRPPA